MVWPVVWMWGRHVSTVMVNTDRVMFQRHRRTGVMFAKVGGQSLGSRKQAVLKTSVETAEEVAL